MRGKPCSSHPSGMRSNTRPAHPGVSLRSTPGYSPCIPSGCLTELRNRIHAAVERRECVAITIPKKLLSAIGISRLHRCTGASGAPGRLSRQRRRPRPDALQQHRRRLVVGVLRHQLAAERALQNRLPKRVGATKFCRNVPVKRVGRRQTAIRLPGNLPLHANRGNGHTEPLDVFAHRRCQRPGAFCRINPYFILCRA